MVSQVRLFNYLATTKIDPSSCRGFEDEAFQALYGLVHYVEGSELQRNAWYRAVWNAHQNSTGTLKAGPANKSFFYSAVLNRKNSAFGYSLSTPKAGTLDAGQYPWALDDSTFDMLNDEVKQGKGPAGDRERSWDELEEAGNKWRKDKGLATPVAVMGWSVISYLVKKYAPEAAAWLVKRSPRIAAIGGLALYVGNGFNNWTIRTNNATAKANFATDETRRLFDRSHALTPGETEGSS